MINLRSKSLLNSGKMDLALMMGLLDRTMIQRMLIFYNISSMGKSFDSTLHSSKIAYFMWVTSSGMREYFFNSQFTYLCNVD